MWLKIEKGVLIAIFIILLWFATLFCLLQFYQFSWSNPFTYFFILLQSHLYTGLFITAHDAMHGTVSSDKKINSLIGKVAATLFAYNSYKKLFPKHHMHHRFVASDKDPDYYDGNFLSWYFKFAKEYVSVWQILLMAGTYELLLLAFPKPNVIFYYIIPSILATLQLFYFGTYLPHRGEHDNRHKSSTQKKNHFWAFISCYFFGYHYEHHNSPGVPWWQLHKEKEKLAKQ